MYHYFVDHNKKCICCKANIFILLDGYIICSKCGLILESLTAENDFTPAGYFRKSSKRKKESKQRKKEKFKKYYLQKYKKVQKSPKKSIF
jgi:hypothetical protein